MLKSSPIFKRNGAHLVGKKMFEKNKDCPFLRFEWFDMQKHYLYASSFERINFAINEKYSQKIYENSSYYASLVIFQTYKRVILKSVHSLGWLLWLHFYPLGFAKYERVKTLFIFHAPNNFYHDHFLLTWNILQKNKKKL